jgi:hypothetical protein
MAMPLEKQQLVGELDVWTIIAACHSLEMMIDVGTVCVLKFKMTLI